MKITYENRAEIQAQYIERIIDGMSTKDMAQILFDLFDEEKDGFDNEQLETEILEFYPDLLGVEDDE